MQSKSGRKQRRKQQQETNKGLRNTHGKQLQSNKYKHIYCIRGRRRTDLSRHMGRGTNQTRSADCTTFGVSRHWWTWIGRRTTISAVAVELNANFERACRANAKLHSLDQHEAFVSHVTRFTPSLSSLSLSLIRMPCLVLVVKSSPALT